MKKIIAILLVAAAMYHFGFESTESVRTAIVERTAAIDSI